MSGPVPEFVGFVDSESLYDYPLEFLAPGCTFCSQFGDAAHPRKGASGLIFGSDFERTLYQNDDFVVVPALGQLIPGWTMLVTRKHFLSIADVEPQLQEPLVSLALRISDAIRTEYSTDVVVMEHGARTSDDSSGMCIAHAHLHFVPTAIDLYSILQLRHNLVEIKSLHDLFSYIPGTQRYLLFSTPDGRTFVAFLQDEKLPCQYLRRTIAHNLGVPERWDWRKHVGRHSVLETITRLKGKFL